MGGLVSSPTKTPSPNGGAKVANVNGSAGKVAAAPDETPIEVFQNQDVAEQDHRKTNAAGIEEKSFEPKIKSVGSVSVVSKLHEVKVSHISPHPSPQPTSKANSKAEIGRSAKKIAHRDFDEEDVELIDEGIPARQHTFKNVNTLSVRGTHSTQVHENDGDEDEELNSNRLGSTRNDKPKSSFDQFGNRQYDDDFEPANASTQMLGKKNFFERNFAAESENAQVFVALARDQIQEVKKEQKKEHKKEKKKDKETDKLSADAEAPEFASMKSSMKGSKREKKKKKKTRPESRDQEGAGIGIPYDD